MKKSVSWSKDFLRLRPQLQDQLIQNMCKKLNKVRLNIIAYFKFESTYNTFEMLFAMFFLLWESISYGEVLQVWKFLLFTENIKYYSFPMSHLMESIKYSSFRQIPYSFDIKSHSISSRSFWKKII